MSVVGLRGPAARRRRPPAARAPRASRARRSRRARSGRPTRSAPARRVAADEGGPLEDDVVELPRARSFAPTAQTSAPVAQPLAAQHGIARGRDRDDDVLLGGLARATRPARRRLARRRPRAARACGSRRRRARSSARRPGCRDLRLGLPAAADHAERARARAGRGTSPRRRSPRRCAAGRACRPRSPRRARRSRASKSETTKRRRRAETRVGLHARVAELEVGRGHDGEAAVLEREPPPRHVLDRARAPCRRKHASTAGHRLAGREQRRRRRPRSGRAAAKPTCVFG